MLFAASMLRSANVPFLINKFPASIKSTVPSAIYSAVRSQSSGASHSRENVRGRTQSVAAVIAANLTAAGMDQPLQQLMGQQQQKQLLQQVAEKQPRIFYHYPCPDGVFAALAATLFFRSRGIQPQYVPFEVYRTPDLQALQLQPTEVAFLLDYCGPAGFPQQLAQHVSRVVVLDHHKTAAEQLSDRSSHPANLDVLLDMTRSGAAIARDFFQATGLSSSVQQMFGWVEDADLWRWSLPDSASFHAGLAALKLEYSALKNPDIWDQLLELNTQEVLDKGRQVIEHQEQLISQAVSAAVPYQLGAAEGLTRGWGCCLGCCVAGDLVSYRSKLGNSLAVRSKEMGLKPVGLVAYTEADMPNSDTHIKVSLRSIDGFDTSAVTNTFGGGGHAAASSCIIPIKDFESWRAMAG